MPNIYFELDFLMLIFIDKKHPILYNFCKKVRGWFKIKSCFPRNRYNWCRHCQINTKISKKLAHTYKTDCVQINITVVSYHHSFIRKISLISCKDNLTNWIPFLITEFCLEQFKLSIFLKNIILRKMFIGQCALCYFYTQYFEPFKYPSRPKEPNSKCINITFDPQDRLDAILSEALQLCFT